MSSTAVHCSPHSLGGRETMAMSRPYTSWAPDPYAPRDSTHHSHHHPEQAVRLPPPTSLVAAPPGAHDAPRIPNPPYQPRPNYTYHDPYVPSPPAYPQQPSLPPQQGAPVVYPNTNLAMEQRRRGSDMSQVSPTFPANTIDNPDAFESRRHSHFAPERPVAEPGCVPFGFNRRPSGASILIGSSTDSTQPRLSAGSIRMQPSTPVGQFHVTRPGFEARPDLVQAVSPPGLDRSSTGPPIDYKLRIRQQPVAARSCGFGERDRRVIDPPPIVQLVIDGPQMTEEDRSEKLRYPHYVMSCSIYDESGGRDASFMPEEYRHQRRLMGSLVGAPFVGQDENGEEGCFFCFPDLSCRTPGAFRLKFSLVRIEPSRASQVRHFPVLVEINSDVFTVYNAKDFPGMQASTSLTKRLKEQGCIISIKKGNEKKGNERPKNSRGLDELSDGDPDDEESSQGKRRRQSIIH